MRSDQFRQPIPRLSSHAIIPNTSTLLTTIAADKDGRFKLPGTGNEKRGMNLLIRGDIRVINWEDTSFFGCLNCGDTTFKFHGSGCSKCGTKGTVYSFDGVWKNSTAVISVGEYDRRVEIIKL